VELLQQYPHEVDNAATENASTSGKVPGRYGHFDECQLATWHLQYTKLKTKTKLLNVSSYDPPRTFSLDRAFVKGVEEFTHLSAVQTMLQRIGLVCSVVFFRKEYGRVVSCTMIQLYQGLVMSAL